MKLRVEIKSISKVCFLEHIEGNVCYVVTNDSILMVKINDIKPISYIDLSGKSEDYIL